MSIEYSMNNNGDRSQSPERQTIIAALEDPRFDWRTVDGIAEQTHLPESDIRRVLEESEDEVVRSSIPDKYGRVLYTTRKHYKETHGLGARFLSALADRVA